MKHDVERRGLGPFSVAPIGFGAMRLTGPNVFGPPRDRREAIRVLREAIERGVDHIDTAQFYGPNIVNELIREALHPYPPELILVSKVGARRDAEGGVLADDEPHQLRRAIEANLRTLDVDDTSGRQPAAHAKRGTGCVLRRSARRHDLGARRRLDQLDRSQQHLSRTWYTHCKRQPSPACRTSFTSRTANRSRYSRSARGGESRSCRSGRSASV